MALTATRTSQTSLFPSQMVPHSNTAAEDLPSCWWNHTDRNSIHLAAHCWTTREIIDCWIVLCCAVWMQWLCIKPCCSLFARVPMFLCAFAPCRVNAYMFAYVCSHVLHMCVRVHQCAWFCMELYYLLCMLVCELAWLSMVAYRVMFFRFVSICVT